MSPTTLYREGTDLDGLLAELDTRYPGQVRVVEVTHPREGGVLGFFAKQRVGVHYRLVDPAQTPVTAPGFDKGASRMPGRNAVPGSRAIRPAAPDATTIPAYDAPAASAQSGVLQDGFGPDPAMIRAALARRAPAPAAPSPAGGFPASADAATTADQATAAPDAAALPGMAFAQILADLALKKAAATSDASAAAGSARSGSRPTAPRTAPTVAAIPTGTAARAEATAGAAARAAEPEPIATLPGASAVSATAQTFAAMDFAALTPVSIAGSDTKSAGAGAARAGMARAGGPGTDGFARDAVAAGRALNAAAAIGHDDLAATTALAAAPLITLRRRGSRAVPRPQEPALVAHAPADPAARGITADSRTALDPAALDPVSFDRAVLDPPAAETATPHGAAIDPATGHAAASPEPDVRPAFTTLPRVDATGATTGVARPIEASQPTGPTQPIAAATSIAVPRPGTLSWPLAAGGDVTRAATAAGRAPGVTAVLERPEPDGAIAVARGISMRDSAHQEVDAHSGTGHSTPLTLRRKLLEVGVPVDRVPTDAVHVYAAIEDLIGGLAPAPELPAGPGRILAIAGPARDAVAAADAVLAGNPGVFEKTWTYRCPATLSTRRVSTTANALTSVAQASEIATATRESSDGPVLVVVATDRATSAGADTALEVLDALAADAAWAAVDATRKPADTRRALRGLPNPDAIVVANAERSTSPATVWELGLPIAMVDGRPSTGPTWAVLLLGKLSELEESGCSAALC